MTKKTIYLVTGAAGFLGSHICRQLLERGERVRVLVLKGDPAISYVPEQTEIVEGDLCDAESLTPFFQVGEDTETVVIHCASMVTVNPEFSQRLLRVNVGGWYSKTKAMASQLVLDAVREKGLNACIVHPSGILGPDDYAVGETTSTIIKIMNGEMTMGMGGSFNLCDVRDLAAGCIAAADKGRSGKIA